MGKRILITGGRDFLDRKFIHEVLDYVFQKRLIDVLIHGDARGVDTLAKNWAKNRGVQVIGYPANWTKYGDLAGPARNSFMLEDSRPDAAIIFPGGNGTADMTKKIQQATLPYKFAIDILKIKEKKHE